VIKTLQILRDETPRRARARIGHFEAEQRVGRNDFGGRNGDRINAALAAAGFDFPPPLRWVASLLRPDSVAPRLLKTCPLVYRSDRFFANDYFTPE
jgi:hypothetical protein